MVDLAREQQHVRGSDPHAVDDAGQQAVEEIVPGCQNTGSMFEGITNTVAMPIARPNNDSWRISFQFIRATSAATACYASRQIHALPASQYQRLPVLSMSSPCGAGSALLNWIFATAFPSFGSSL